MLEMGFPIWPHISKIRIGNIIWGSESTHLTDHVSRHWSPTVQFALPLLYALYTTDWPSRTPCKAYIQQWCVIVQTWCQAAGILVQPQQPVTKCSEDIGDDCGLQEEPPLSTLHLPLKMIGKGSKIITPFNKYHTFHIPALFKFSGVTFQYSSFRGKSLSLKFQTH